MSLNTITNRYIIKEMLAPFSINLLVFTFLFLMTEMIEITDWIVNYKLNVLAVLKLIFFTLPWFLMFIIPMSVMMAVLLTFLRMSNDNEIVALKSCGLSIYRLLSPVLAFAMFGCLCTAFITMYGVPHSKMALEEMAIRLAASHADIGLKERTGWIRIEPRSLRKRIDVLRRSLSTQIGWMRPMPSSKRLPRFRNQQQVGYNSF